jgi:hypothetical protein
MAALNKGGWAQVWSVSCATAGNCAAGGVYVEPVEVDVELAPGRPVGALPEPAHPDQPPGTCQTLRTVGRPVIPTVCPVPTIVKPCG